MENYELATIEKFNREIEIVNALIKSEALPGSIKNPVQAVAILKYGKEIGMDTMTALTNISLIKGSMYVATEKIIDNFIKLGGAHRVVEMTDTVSTIKLMDKYGSWFDFTFTFQDATKKGLTKSNTTKYGKEMNTYVTNPKRALFLNNIRQGILTIMPEAKFGNISNFSPVTLTTPMNNSETQVSEVIQKTPEKKLTDSEKFMSETKAEELALLEDYRIEMGLTPNAVYQPILEHFKVFKVDDIPTHELSAYIKNLRRDLDEHRRLSKLTPGEMKNEIENLLKEVTTNEEIDIIDHKYSKYKSFGICKISLVAIRNQINSKNNTNE